MRTSNKLKSWLWAVIFLCAFIHGAEAQQIQGGAGGGSGGSSTITSPIGSNTSAASVSVTPATDANLAKETGGNLATIAGAVSGGKTQDNISQVGGTSVTLGLAGSTGAFPVVISGPNTVTATVFQSPHATSAYTANQLVANSATAASVTPMSFSFTAGNGIPVAIKSGLLKVTTASGGVAPTITGGTFAVHFYTQTPGTPTNGDGGTYQTVNANYCGSLTGALSQQIPNGTDYSQAMLSPMLGSEVDCTPTGPGNTVYALLQVIGTGWTPSTTTYNYQVTATAQ